MATENTNLTELYRRATSDPTSITRAEHNLIHDWPSPEEEDRLCVARTGHTRAELVTIAVANPEDLTYDEAMILYHSKGVRFDADDGLS